MAGAGRLGLRSVGESVSQPTRCDYQITGAKRRPQTLLRLWRLQPSDFNGGWNGVERFLIIFRLASLSFFLMLAKQQKRQLRSLQVTRVSPRTIIMSGFGHYLTYLGTGT